MPIDGTVVLIYLQHISSHILFKDAFLQQSSIYEYSFTIYVMVGLLSLTPFTNCWCYFRS